jgi:hypothetical protein
MSIVETIEDGWDCEPKLKEAVEKIEELDHYKYEINRCVRSSELESMVVEMVEIMEDAIEILNGIDVNVEYETVDDDE